MSDVEIIIPKRATGLAGARRAASKYRGLYRRLFLRYDNLVKTVNGEAEFIPLDAYKNIRPLLNLDGWEKP